MSARWYIIHTTASETPEDSHTYVDFEGVNRTLREIHVTEWCCGAHRAMFYHYVHMYYDSVEKGMEHEKLLFSEVYMALTGLTPCVDSKIALMSEEAK